MEEYRNFLYVSTRVYDQPRRSGWDGTAAVLECALNLFDRSRGAAWVEKVKSLLLRHSCSLFDLEMLPASQVRSRRYAGIHSINLNDIRGTLGRKEDFDARFHPLSERVRDRWVGVAVNRLQCIPLPPVSLIQVGGCFFVQDGHHRISVARALGETAIEAEIFRWDVAGPTPFEMDGLAILQKDHRQAGTRGGSPALASWYASSRSEG